MKSSSHFTSSDFLLSGRWRTDIADIQISELLRSCVKLNADQQRLFREDFERQISRWKTRGALAMAASRFQDARVKAMSPSLVAVICVHFRPVSKLLKPT